MTHVIHRNRPSGLFQSAIKPLSRGIAVAVALAATPLAFAQDDEVLEEVLITGSLIKGMQTDSVQNVSAYDRSALDMQNTPTITDFIKNLSFSSGVDGDSNQFESNATEGLSNVNLRGLGPARTLVLINGQRQVAVPVRLGAGRFVDTNSIPSAAVERVEILKEGAAATYGSDAIGGVVNFRTRKDFEGFEIQGGFADIEDSDGDMNLSAIFGTVIGDFNWVTSIGLSSRSQLRQRDRDWSSNLDGSAYPFGGYSSIGNPGTLYPFLDTNPAGDGLGLDTIIGPGLPDPGCEDVGSLVAGGACRFQYTQFDNLVEDEEHWQVFSELNGELSGGQVVHLEFMYAETDVPNWATSPSYPPQRLIDPVQSVTADNPGWASFTEAFPGYLAALPAVPDYIIMRGRVNGAGANGPREAKREYETLRFAGSIEGQFDNDIGYTVNAAYSHSEGGFNSVDASIEKTALAFRGYGGEGCGATLNNDESVSPNGAIAGAGDCVYYNPFSTAIQFGYNGQFENPNYDASVANSQALQDWIDDEWEVRGENDLFTADVIFNQSVENIDLAYGLQYRYNEVSQDVDSIANLADNPCRVTGYKGCPESSQSGLHSFLAAGSDFDLDSTVYAAFGEANIELSDKLNMNVGVRYENYGDGLDTFDPKVAMQYHFNDNLSLRTSFQTTYRAPDPNQLDDSTSTGLSFVLATLAFKAIDATGNPDLEPESAFTYNMGLVWSSDNFQASLDYWAFDFKNPIITESFNQIVGAYDAGGDSKAAVQSQITCQGGVTDGSCAASGIERIQVNIVNGPRTQTNGFDFYSDYSTMIAEMPVNIGLEGTYTLKYSVDSYSIGDTKVADGFEAAGFYNSGNNVRPIQDLKMRVHLNVAINEYLNALMYVNYTSEYDDRRDAVKSSFGVDSVDDHTTIDFHLSTTLMDDSLSLTASVLNATDEDPPVAYGDLMYDAYSHNPLGRMLKVGFKYSM